MKITNFNTQSGWNKQSGKREIAAGNEPVRKPVFRKASGGEDYLEISREAAERHMETKILSFTEARLKKMAHNAEHLSDNSRSGNSTAAGITREMINSDKYDFNSHEVLAGTAERILGLIG